MKVILKPEKTMAVDLKPGDVFVMELPDPQFFTRQLEEEIAIPVLLRTNIDASDATDALSIVYRLNITIVNNGHPLDMRVDPFLPPGMKS
jgi:hypothetical protein